jgi:hypothetical protein
MDAVWNFPSKNTLKPNKKLPDPLTGPDGKRISSPAEWPAQQEYLKAMLEHYLYGHTPREPFNTRGEVVKAKQIYDGLGLRETVRISCGPGGKVVFNTEIVRPNRSGPFPVIIGNDTVFPHEMMRGFDNPEELETSLKRNFRSGSYCPIEEELLSRGYAVASFIMKELCPDGPDYQNGQVPRAYPDYDWRAIAIWSWGHSRIVDYLETVPWADKEKLVTTGLSRGGKTAIHSAIFDERFAVCASSCSGCGGAGNFRYLGGRMGIGLGYTESIADITGKNSVWHFFSDKLAEFGSRKNQSEVGDEAYLPFDTHFLRALIAPRAIISTDGLDDVWCGAFGTQLSWHASQPVFNFLNAEGRNALFFREGGHYYSDRDWREVLAFCDKIFYGFDTPHTYTEKCFHNVHRIYFNDFFEYE